MPENQFGFELDFDYADLTKGLAEIVNAGKQVVTQFDKVGKSIEESFKGLNATVKSIETAIGQLGAAIKQVQQPVQKTISDFDRMKTAVNSALSGVNSQIEAIKKSIRQNNMKEWQKLADDYAVSISRAKSQVEALNQQLKNAKLTDEERLKIQEKIKVTQDQINNLAKVQAQNVQLKRIAEDARAAQDAVREAGTALRNVGMVAAGAGAAIFGMMSDARDVYAEFQSTMTAFKAISGASVDSFGAFEAKAKELGASTKFTAQEIASAGVELAKMGFSADQTTDAIEGITTAAVASQVDLQKMGTVVAENLRSFGMEASESTKVADIMTNAFNKSGLSLESFAYSMKYAGPVAAAAGQDMEDVTALLGIMADRGIKGSTAGTSLRTMFTNLQAPTAAASRQLERFNLSIANQDGSMRNIIDIIKDLKGSLEGVSRVEQAGIIKDLFGKQALSGMQTLLSLTNEQFEQAVANLTNFNGAAERTANEMKKTLLFSMQELAASIEAAKIAFMQSLEPALITINKAVKSVFDTFSQLPKPIRDMAAFGVASFAGLLTVFGVGGLLVVGINAAIISLGSLANGFLALATGAPAIAAGNMTIAGSFTAIRASIAALGPMLAGAATALGSFAVAAAPFVALAGALYAAWEYNLGGFKDIFINAGKAVAEVITGMEMDFEGFIWFLQGLKQAAEDTFLGVVGLIDHSMRAIFGIIDGTFRLISDIMVIFGALFTGNFKLAFDHAAELASGFTRVMEKGFGDFFNNVGKMLLAFGKMFAASWQMITNPLSAPEQLQKIASAWEDLKTAASGMGEAWNATFSDMSGKLAEHGRKVLGWDERLKKAAQERKSKEKLTPDADSPDNPAAFVGKPGKDKADRELDAWLKATEVKYDKLIEKDKQLLASQRENAQESNEITDQFSAKLTASADNVATRVMKTTNRCLEGVNRAFLAATGKELLYAESAYLAAEQLSKDARFKEVDWDRKRTLPAGSVVVWDRSPNVAARKQKRGWEHGHISIADGKGNEMSDHKTRQMTAHYAGGAPRVFQPIGTVSGAGPSTAELEATQKQARLQQQLNEMYAKRNEVQAKYGASSAQMQKIVEAIANKEKELESTRTKSAEARAKAIEDQKKAIAAAEKDILGLQMQNRMDEIALMDDTVAQLEERRKLDLARIIAEEDEKIAAFKGTADQLVQLQEAYDKKLLLKDQDYGQKIKAAREARAAELEALELKYTDDQQKRAEAEINNRVKEELKAIGKMQQVYAQGSAEWARLEALKTKATKRGAKDRMQAELDARKRQLDADKALIESSMTDNTRAFMESLRGMIQERQNTGKLDPSGMSGGVTAALFKPDEVWQLAEALKAGGIQESMEQIVQLGADVGGRLSIARRELALMTNGSDEYKTKQAEINGLMQQFAQFEAMITLMQDERFKAMLAAYQLAIPKQKEMVNQSELFRGAVEGIGQTLSGFARAFGESGRDIAAVIDTTTSTIIAGSRILDRMNAASAAATEAMGFGEMLGALTKDGDAMKDTFSAALAMLPALIEGTRAWGDAFAGLFGGGEMNRAAQALANNEANARMESELETQRYILEQRRKTGEATLQQELDFIEAEHNFKMQRIAQQQQQLQSGPGTGPFGLRTIQDELKAREESAKLQREMEQAERDREKRRAEAQQQSAKARMDKERAIEDRLAETRLLLAENADNELEQIKADGAIKRLQIEREYTDALTKLMGDQTATAADYEALLAKFKAELAQNDKRIADETLQANLARRKAELEAEQTAEMHKLELRTDGAQKDIATSEAALRHKLALMDLELEGLKQGTDDYKRLAAERAQAEEEGQARIRRQIDETAKRRKEDLENYRSEIAQLQAELAENPMQAAVADAQRGFLDVERWRQAEIEKAQADYANYEENVTLINQLATLKRQKTQVDASKAVKDALIKNAEETGRKQLEAQLEPLQRIIRAEESRIKQIQGQNVELERQLDLIDRRFDKEREDFERRDRGMFDELLGQVDLQAAQRRGIDYIANTEGIDDPVGRSTSETQLRGLMDLLAIEEQNIESKLKLEEVTEAQYLAEMERITIVRAAAIQSAMEEAETDKVRSERLAQLAEQYSKYQELVTRGIDARRSAERRAHEEQIANNNQQIADGQYVVEQKKLQMEQITASHDENMAQVIAGINSAQMASNEWGNAIVAMGPKFAEMARQAKLAIGQINQELGAFIQASQPQYYNTPFYDQTGAGIGVQHIPSRNQQTTDKDGVFSVQGSDGKWYRTTTEMQRAIAGFAEGGEIPDVSLFRNDNAIVRVSAGERILNREFNRRLGGMLDRFEAPSFASPMGGQVVSFGDIIVSRDVDINKLESIFSKYLGAEGRRQIKRMGPNVINVN